MSNCRSIDPLVTPFIDGELPAADASAVASHLRACGNCRARVAVERSVRDLMRRQQGALQSPAAPAALRGRCAMARGAALAAAPRTAGTRRLFQRLAPLAVAAALVLIVGGAFLYRMTQLSTRVMAAELTADHLKCAAVNAIIGTAQTPAAVESSLAARFNWHAHLPERPEEAGLELVGARPCLYGEGKIAHIMYRHEGKTVSVFMLPRTARGEHRLGIMGHQAAVWSEGDRTFVVIARKSASDAERLANFIRERLR
jgi:anti-sigma factor RsiW